MKQGTRELLTEIEIDYENLSVYQQQIIDAFESHGFLRSPGIFLSNEYIPRTFIYLLKKNEPYQFFLNFLNVIGKENSQIIAFSTEWFSNIGTGKDHNLLQEGHIDAKVFNKLWEDHYSEVNSFYLFNSANINYTAAEFNNYQRVLFNLYRYCGLSHQFIEAFFEPHFQDFWELINAMITAHVSAKPINALFSVISTKLGLDVKDAIDQQTFNSAVNVNEVAYINLISDFLDHFETIRACTLAMIESYPYLSMPHVGAALKGDMKIQDSAFYDFNDSLVKLSAIEDHTIEREDRRKIDEYLSMDYHTVTDNAGFLNLAKRQKVVQESKLSGDYQKMKADLTTQELEQLVESRNQDLDDLATLHRLKFIITKAGVLNSAEKILFYDKLSKILISSEPNYYSDIFELYFYFLVKNSGVPIEMLTSQKIGNNEKSTCDYKLGSNIAADCKCVISDNMQLYKISEWSNKIGSQIKSTLGWCGVEFGGGVIAMKDQGFAFLDALSKFDGRDKGDIEERAYLIHFLLEAYSEFRRHTVTKQEQIKFLVLYYIPNNHVKIDETIRLSPTSTKRVNEILALFTTKYASDEEIVDIENVFKTVCPFIFKFNNRLT